MYSTTFDLEFSDNNIDKTNILIALKPLRNSFVFFFFSIDSLILFTAECMMSE